MSAGRAPLPLLALAIAAIALAFSADQPLVIAAIALGSATLAVAAGRAAAPLVLAGAISGVGLVVLTPLLGASGNLILLELPDPPLINAQVTVEEVAAGAVSGLRVFAVTALIGATLVLMDQDRALALAMRLAPRSALACALAARALPTLRRDARSLAETARGRGIALSRGGWLARGRCSAPLLVPLVGSSLERSLDVAEAMSARGYGAGGRTRIREPGASRSDIAIFAAAGLLAVAFGAGAPSGALGYGFYPELDRVLGAPAIVVAVAAGIAIIGAARAARR